MKRDMELVRKILMTIHDLDGGYVTGRLTIDGYTEKKLGITVSYWGKLVLLMLLKTAALAQQAQVRYQKT